MQPLATIVLLLGPALPACLGVDHMVSPLALGADSLAGRRAQTRTYEDVSEIELLRACVALLQDVGFHIDESESRLGVLVASKERDAKELVQHVFKYVLLLFTGADVPADEIQLMRASVVTHPVGPVDRERVAVRVTFLRIVWDDSDEISRYEALDEPEYYREFFERLTSTMFLEGRDP